ncbi:Heterogeneous nuclear ribonucleoprotein L [Stylophora pistillata]|uniref:Heterogeneous nuclear ribonucleoprotein L n=1 Tax=Stylophora pistillata TaxID=50429 RepID=A0A2B4RW55_STYPI|nr:Heterogeneous nuclear ribonucleoprotein L [Stylophora pistillata]
MNMAEKHALHESDEGYAESGYENGGFKRQKLASGEIHRTYQAGGGGNPHYTDPSPVIHVRGVADEAREQDLMHALSSFGPISCVTMMPKLRQALVEFDDVSSAKSLMDYTQSGQTIVLRGRPAYFNFSKSKSISNKQGQVLRIVIFRKSGLQAMVEFATVDQAQQAKDVLNRADIYTGCNTLKIEYSRATSLNVYKNDEETFDYTEDKAYEAVGVRPPMKEGLLSRPPGGPYPGRGGMVMRGPRPLLQQSPMAGGCVLMVYGLHQHKMNCDRVFNILCCYGNVLKVKFLMNKPGAAMVELSDHVACNTVIQCMRNQQLFGEQLEFSFSKQKYLVDASTVSDLPDGTPCYKTYANSKNQRFWTPEQSSKNRIFSPTKVLHFLNAPPDFDTEKVKEMCSNCGVEPPVAVKVFPNASRSAAGLLEWNSPSQALDALAACNHYVIRDPAAKTIFTVKLAFSSMSSAQ